MRWVNVNMHVASAVVLSLRVHGTDPRSLQRSPRRNVQKLNRRARPKATVTVHGRETEAQSIARISAADVVFSARMHTSHVPRVCLVVFFRVSCFSVDLTHHGRAYYCVLRATPSWPDTWRHRRRVWATHRRRQVGDRGPGGCW